METLKQITDGILYSLQNGEKPITKNIDVKLIESLIHDTRAAIYGEKKSEIIPMQWIQNFISNPSEQEDDIYSNESEKMLRFPIPSPLSDDGFVYVGKVDDTSSFDRIGLLGISNDMLHRLSNPYKNGKIAYDYGLSNVTGKMEMRLYGKIDKQNFKMVFIHSDPTENPKYEKADHVYPIENKFLFELKIRILKTLRQRLG